MKTPADKGKAPRAKRAAAPPPMAIYEQVVESLTSGVIVLDAEGHILAANRAAAHQLCVSPALLKRGKPLAKQPVLEAFANLFTEIQQHIEPVYRRELLLETDQGSKTIGVTASVLRDDAQFIGAIFLFIDLSAVRALERSVELNRQLAQIGELTAGVVHELRNPLSVISGMAELLLRRLGEGHPLERHASTICHEAGELEKLIRQFLLFARPFGIERSRCAPDEIVDRALTLCERMAREKGVHIHVQHLPDAPVLEVDYGRMAQALSNLVRNAIEILKPGGRIHIRTIPDDGAQLSFLVEDNGPGIQLAQGEDLFSPFFSKKEGGTGLGLSICHRIVTGHGGTITFGNREAGGAWFRITVPVTAQTLAAP